MLETLLVYLVAVVGVLGFVYVCFAAGMLYRRLFGLPIWVKFLERTGYRRKEDPSAPIEQQAHAIMREIFRPEGVARGPWIREIEGHTLTYSSLMYREGDENVTQESWQLELPSEVRMQVQILERGLAKPGLLQKLADAALGRSRRWGELLPHELRTGDKDFDERFVVRADKGQAPPRFLTDPEARQALATLPAACVVVAQRWVVLDDPEGTLRRKYVGMAVTPRQMMEREPPVHEHAANVLLTLARSIRAQAAR
ncbi:MAG: hypothetical protein U1A78_30355 [Polyangia bacterium]